MVFTRSRPTSFVATQKGPLKTHHVFSCPVGEISHVPFLLGLGLGSCMVLDGVTK